jgi:hypothetical protein
MVVSCLVLLLLVLLVKTGKNRLAKFNTLRSMVVLNVLEILYNTTVIVKLCLLSPPVVLAAQKGLGPTGLLARLLAAMVEQCLGPEL